MSFGVVTTYGNMATSATNTVDGRCRIVAEQGNILQLKAESIVNLGMDALEDVASICPVMST